MRTISLWEPCVGNIHREVYETLETFRKRQGFVQVQGVGRGALEG
jgi:hypothetical protein